MSTLALAAPTRIIQPQSAPTEAAVSVQNLVCKYGQITALNNVSLDIYKQQVTALIGASGCGKSSFLRCINRMNDEIIGCEVSGKIIFDGLDITDPSIDVTQLRSRIGMVFQKANCFPKSIYDNVAYGLRIHGMTDNMDYVVEQCLIQAGLWDEVKNRLHANALSLSGGQQQRLCIARAIAISPEVILMDEPCSALDPIATARIEELIRVLSQNFTIVIVTHSMQQAKRVSDRTAFFHMGEIVESGDTDQIFDSPKLKKTRDYITGRFG